MASRDRDSLEPLLRRRVSDFLTSRAAHRASLRPFLHQVSKLSRSAFLFGGTLRDLMLFGLRTDPRDVDVVVLKLSSDLRSFLEPHVRRNTRFGGVEVSLGHWDVDLWELSSTWAFRAGLVKAEGYGDLPKTTFLDVQAIAVEVTSRPGHARRIFEHGFFKAVRQRTADINLEENPYPARCVLSALATAHKLGFSMAPKLVRYVLHHGAQIDLHELCGYQLQQLGHVPFNVDTLRTWMNHLASCHRCCPSVPVRLPTRDQTGRKLQPRRRH